ncbi:hypothetical protein [Defluviimonas sp. D31]|uniref:winged helix domain-containing protein n=1 Tax=Defluviimonas sp. D31 TaxID=3083253 RepID=UPI003990B33B
MKVNVTLSGGDGPRTFRLCGRLGWTLYQLFKAGQRGVTPLECPALRWSSYVHKLRQKGVPIDTEMEEHSGAYSGRHARYRLACDVSLIVSNPEGHE